MDTSEGSPLGFEAIWKSVSGTTGRSLGLLSAVAAAAILSIMAGCAYELPEQPTVFITRKTPDDLATILSQRKAIVGKLTVLGGQILRRKDTPVGRYFLIRAMELTEDSYPSPPSKGTIVSSPNTRNAYILFVPSLRMIGRTKPKTHKERSAFIVFGEHEDRTLVMGPGHLVTTVGELKGMIHFPSQPKGPRYLLIVSHYILLWSKADPSDYPLIPY
jgi:hypothetical protein